MDIRLLRAFLTVADLRHYSRAAEALHVSQPALSKQIASLEASLGARLFERGRHGAELTPFGTAFLPDAQALVRDADALLARAREAGSGKRGRLRVGLCLSVLSLAPGLIADFRRLHPNVSVTLTDLSSSEQTRRLLSGQLDVGFMRLPADAGLSSFPMIEESLALAVPQHASFTRLPTDLSILNELGFVALAHAKGPGLAAQIERWCAEHHFVPRVLQQAEDVQSILATVAAGVGVAFVPSQTEYLLRDAKVIKLRGRNARWRIGLTWQTQRDDAVMRRFVTFARSALKEKNQAA